MGDSQLLVGFLFKCLIGKWVCLKVASLAYLRFLKNIHLFRNEYSYVLQAKDSMMAIQIGTLHLCDEPQKGTLLIYTTNSNGGTITFLWW